MHAAKQQLDIAEASFIENGDTQDTRDQSYLAVRKAEFAEVIARTMQSNQATDGVVRRHARRRKEDRRGHVRGARSYQDTGSPPRALRSKPRALRSRTRKRAGKRPKSAPRKRPPISPSSRR